jgi:hypothetical protein
MPHNNNGEYHGPEFCPKCGFDGLRAVTLAMQYKDAQRSEAATPTALRIEAPAVPPTPPPKKDREKLRAEVEKLRSAGRTRAYIIDRLQLSEGQADTFLYPKHPAKKASLPPRPADKVCPECGKGGFTPQGLGAHRRQVHGIVGAGRERDRKDATAPTPPV